MTVYSSSSHFHVRRQVIYLSHFLTRDYCAGCAGRDVSLLLCLLDKSGGAASAFRKVDDRGKKASAQPIPIVHHDLCIRMTSFV